MRLAAMFLARAALCGLTAALTAGAAVAARSPTYEAEIRRTSYGIPHIKAKDEASLGYGAGYAYAEDNVCVFADEMLTVNGMRSEYFGPDVVAGPDVDSGSINSTNRNSDFYFKLVNSDARVEAGWRRQPPEVKALLRGYAAGFNRYLVKTGRDRLPVACRNAAWVRPITPLDLVRIARRYEVDFSSMRFIDGLVAAQPPGAAQALQKTTAVTPWRPHYGLGSNAVALGKDATANGRGLLLGNPHYPWHGILRLYQQHLTIPGRKDIMGVTLPGLPTIVIGFTRNFAWSHTVNTSTHFTLHALDLDTKDPTRYRVGDEWRRMTKERHQIQARKADGSLETIAHDFWFSMYGPVFVRPGSLEWTGKTAYAIRDANLDNNRMLETWHEMGKARSLKGVERAVKGLVGLPWVNTIAADKDGRALYLDVTPVPNVSAEKQARCIAEPYRKLVAENLYVLSGSDPGCGWDVDPAAPQEGIVSGDRLPTLWRTDYVQNSNDSAWMTNPASPLTGFPQMVSKEGEEQSGRTRMAIGRIAARLAGKDGLEGKGFTLKQLQDISFDNRVFYASLVREDLNALCGEDAGIVTIDGTEVPLGEACATFRAWDGTASANSVGYPLLGLWWDRLEDNKAIWSAPDRQVDGTTIWAVPFSANDPVNTPRGLRRDDPAVVKFARESLGAAILELKKRGIDWRKPWGEIQYVEVKGKRVPVPGGASGDVYNIMYSLPSAPGRMVVALGGSYVQTVAFDDDGPVVDAVLTYSQSSNPDSPHSGDQIGVFSAGQWIRQPFTEAQIKADPVYRTMTVSE